MATPTIVKIGRRCLAYPTADDTATALGVARIPKEKDTSPPGDGPPPCITPFPEKNSTEQSLILAVLQVFIYKKHLALTSSPITVKTYPSKL